MNDSSSCVRVAVRVRPQIARERIDMCRVCTNVTPGEPQVCIGSDKAFTYDYVFDIQTQQKDIYENCVENLVEGCFEGYNATVLAYGQTGSGKTYTMGTGLEIESSLDSVGIIPRAVHHIFNGIHKRRNIALENRSPLPEFKIMAHFMELYNEEIIDLLDSDMRGVGKSAVRIHEDSEGGIFVNGIITKSVTSAEETMRCLRSGALSRTTASTNMNTQSSRSHAIFTLIVTQQKVVASTCVTATENGESIENSEDKEMAELETLTAKFHFVDLAGSERLKRTGATGERAREGISINCGLLALGNVISSLGDVNKKASHVPYRDSKLTRLLQDSLGGNSRTLMIACVSPSDRDFMETLNTLKYANRARNIKNKVVANQNKSSKTIAVLRQQIQSLEIELLEYKQGKRIVNENGIEGTNDMFHENQMLLVESENLRTRVKALLETVDVLTNKNSQLLAEKTAGEWSAAAGEASESPMASVIQNYLREIEELKSKLCESENISQILRKQFNNNRTNNILRSPFSPIHSIAISGSLLPAAAGNTTQDVLNLIEEAKKNVEMNKEEANRLQNQLSPRPVENQKSFQTPSKDFGSPPKNDRNEQCENDGFDDVMEIDDESDDDDDEEENELAEQAERCNAQLADITSEISIKQKLIENLEATQKRLETMRYQYEEKLSLLHNRIKSTQDERDKVLIALKQNEPSGNQSEDRVKSVRNEYEKKLCAMENEVRKLKVAQKEHTKLMRERSAHERQVKTLKSEVGEMKKNKVKLIHRMKEDFNRAKQETNTKNKEIAQLRKEQRKKENYIKTLEADNRLKMNVLKRKTEEISNLKKGTKRAIFNNKVANLSRRINPMANFSPKIAKQRWQSVEHLVNKVAYNKQTVSSLERDMNRWLKERESLCRQLEKLKRRFARADPLNQSMYADLNDQIEACKANIDYIHENINECQENIMSIEENKETYELLEPARLMSGLGAEGAQYLINKLIYMTVNQATIAAQKSAAIVEKEDKMKEMEQTISVQEELLTHVLQDSNDSNVYQLMTSLVAGNVENETNSSNESSRASPILENFDMYQIEKRNDKARSKTTTSDQMLFYNDISKPATLPPSITSSKSHFMLLNPTSISAPATFDPRMTVSLDASRFKKPEIQIGTCENNSQNTNNLKHNFTQDITKLLTKRSNRDNTAIDKMDITVDSTIIIEPSGSAPSSPPALRRNISREDNVFERLTNANLDQAESADCGVINPHSGKVNQRSMLTCTHVAEGHSKAVLSICATDNYLFSGSKDQTVKVWDLVQGEETQTLGGHPNNVTCVKYCQNLNLCFSVSSAFIKVWDLRQSSSKCIKTLTSSGMTNGPLQFSSTGRTLSIPSGEVQINDIALSSQSHTLYSASGNIVRRWDLRKFMPVGKLAGGHQAAVMCLAVDSLSSVQDILITGSKDHYIKVFDVTTNSTSSLINARISLDPPHYDGVQSLAVYDDTLFSGSRDTCIKKWDLKNGELVQSLNNAHKGWICALCYLPGGRVILSGCRNGTVKIWLVDSCSLMGELRAHDAPINAISTNSKCIFTASNDCTIRLWKMRSSCDVTPADLSDS